MMTLVSIALFAVYALFLLVVLERSILHGQMRYVLYYVVLFLPVYLVVLSFVFLNTNSVVLVKIIQYSKELVLIGFGIFWVFSRKNIFKVKWDITSLDFLFLSFIVLAVVFMVLPIGEATLVNKAIYLKNIILMCLVYFLGRNCQFPFEVWNKVFNLVFLVTVVAFIVVAFEKISGTHFHSIIGYAKYNQEINKIEPAGHYGLTWTFEAQGGQKRFGSIFSNPLEFPASMLISFSASIIYLLSVPYHTNKVKYLGLFVLSFACVVLAYSRASFVSFFGMLFFMAVILKLYRIILAGFLLLVLVILYLVYLAPQETQHFILDTITFRNSSSITHVLDWLNAVESIRQNPWGIGLAMSGNAGGVEEDLIVGGENQFLIYGVQLGVLGLVLYTSMVFMAIWKSWSAFNLAHGRKEQVIPFIAATTKFGLLLPMLTANAESYLYVSFFSWWMVGYSMTVLRKEELLRKLNRLGLAESRN